MKETTPWNRDLILNLLTQSSPCLETSKDATGPTATSTAGWLLVCRPPITLVLVGLLVFPPLLIPPPTPLLPEWTRMTTTGIMTRGLTSTLVTSSFKRVSRPHVA